MSGRLMPSQPPNRGDKESDLLLSQSHFNQINLNLVLWDWIKYDRLHYPTLEYLKNMSRKVIIKYDTTLDQDALENFLCHENKKGMGWGSF